MTINSLTLHAPQTKSFDVEAQKSTLTKQANVNLTRAKLAAMATVSVASGLATALLATTDHTGLNHAQGRGLLNQGCDDAQLNKIATAERALIVSGALTGAGIAAAGLGWCVGEHSRDAYQEGKCVPLTAATGCLGQTAALLGIVSTVGGALATIGSGIAYGVLKGKC